MMSSQDLLVFTYSPLTIHPPVGKYNKERVVDPSLYSDLEKIKNWRDVLSPSYVSPNGPFYLDGKHWATINNYYTASKYFYTNPEYSSKFSVESGIDQAALNMFINADRYIIYNYLYLLGQEVADPNYTTRKVSKGYTFNLWCIYRAYVARIFSDNLLMEVLLKTGDANLYLYNSEMKVYNTCDFLVLIRNCLRYYKITRLTLDFSPLLDDPNIINIYKAKRLGFISGPVNLSEHYSSEYNKHIYIFGDTHVKQASCPLVTSNTENTMSLKSFLEKTASETKKPLDIFLEVSYKSKKLLDKINVTNDYQGYIDNIYRLFAPCLEIDKKKCSYKNVRFHYSDIRSYVLLEQITFLSIILSDHTLNDRDLKLIKSYTTLEKTLKNPNIINEVADVLKINKQIKNIPYEKVRRQMEIYKKQIKPLYYDEEIFAVLKRGNSNEIKIYLPKIREYGNYLLLNVAKIMDLYLLGRMFRTFEKPSKSAKNTISDPPQNIIIYVGNAHAANYRSFLQDLKFDLVNVTTSDKFKYGSTEVYQCIDIRGFKYPFFQKPTN